MNTKNVIEVAVPVWMHVAVDILCGKRSAAHACIYQQAILDFTEMDGFSHEQYMKMKNKDRRIRRIKSKNKISIPVSADLEEAIQYGAIIRNLSLRQFVVKSLSFFIEKENPNMTAVNKVTSVKRIKGAREYKPLLIHRKKN